MGCKEDNDTWAAAALIAFWLRGDCMWLASSSSTKTLLIAREHQTDRLQLDRQTLACMPRADGCDRC